MRFKGDYRAARVPFQSSVADSPQEWRRGGGPLAGQVTAPSDAAIADRETEHDEISGRGPVGIDPGRLPESVHRPPDEREEGRKSGGTTTWASEPFDRL